MNRKEVNELYFEWLCRFVEDGYVERGSYRKLLECLYHLEFIYSMIMDANRSDDGISLRYRFADERGYDHRAVAVYLDDKPCSILEMMVALALRCEEHIAYNPEIGDRTSEWFWSMMESLGLGDMTDDIFNEKKVERIVDKFLYREYARNGKGGLFTIRSRKHDMRNVEIWCQLCWHMEEVLYGGKRNG